MLACMSDDALALHGRERSLDLLWLSNDVCILLRPLDFVCRPCDARKHGCARFSYFFSVAFVRQASMKISLAWRTKATEKK